MLMRRHHRLLLSLSAALVFFGGCDRASSEAADSSAETTAEQAAAPAPGRVSGSEARDLVAKGAMLIDVRTPGEYASGHIDGAVNIPIGEFDQRRQDLETIDGPIVVYCQTGGRSASAYEKLRQMGHEQVFDMGGIGEW